MCTIKYTKLIIFIRLKDSLNHYIGNENNYEKKKELILEIINNEFKFNYYYLLLNKILDFKELQNLISFEYLIGNISQYENIDFEKLKKDIMFISLLVILFDNIDNIDILVFNLNYNKIISDICIAYIYSSLKDFYK